MTVDWAAVAKLVRSTGPDGEFGSFYIGQRALEQILGRETIDSAIDWYLAGRDGSECVRSVLVVLCSEYAMERCHQVASGAAPIEERRAAVELLRAFADRRSLPWVREYLESPDADIQNWGASLLDQLVSRNQVSFEEAAPFIAIAAGHQNEGVQRVARLIRDHTQTATD